MCVCVCTIVDQWIDINSVSGCGVMSTKLLATFGLVSGNTLWCAHLAAVLIM